MQQVRVLQQLNIPDELIQAEACVRRSGTNTKQTQHTFPRWSTCCVEGKVLRQLHTCCSSDRDVSEMQLDHFFTNCMNSDRMINNGLARWAETCETSDESLILNFGRGNQGYAIRTAGTDLRVARLWYECEMTCELMTVSSVLNCESGCTIKRASDKGTGRLRVSIACRGVEFCGRRRVPIRKNSEHAFNSLSNTVWQAGVEGTILESAPKQSSASRAASEVASGLVKGRIDRHASQLLGRIDGYVTYTSEQRKDERRRSGQANETGL